MYHTTVSKKHSPEESQILTLITCRTIKKGQAGRLDRRLETWRTRLAGCSMGTSHHIPVSLSCVCSEQQQTCISSSGLLFLGNQLHSTCRYTCTTKRTFLDFLVFFTLLPAKMLLLLLLPLIVTASQGPLPPDFEEASWQKVGVKHIFGL